MPLKDNMEPALREHLGTFIPIEVRNFFWIAAHFDPTPLYTHFYHWWELAQMRDEPHASPIRRGALLYNIFDTRNEGTATGVEEMFMHAGLYDEQPPLPGTGVDHCSPNAPRAGSGALYAHANQNDDGGSRNRARGLDAPRLDGHGTRLDGIRTTTVPAPAGLRHQLRHRANICWKSCSRIAPSKRKTTRCPTRCSISTRN